MKILLITDNYDPLRPGGAENVFFGLQARLIKLGHVVATIGFADIELDTPLTKVIKNPSNLITRHWTRMFFNRKVANQMRAFVDNFNPDLVHLHNINKYTMSLLEVVRTYPSIQTVHDYGLICPTLWNVHNDLTPCPTGLKCKCLFKHRRNYSLLIYFTQLYFFYMRNKKLKECVSEFIVPSPTLKLYMEKQGFENVIVSPNPITDNNLSANFSNIIPYRFIYIGALEENKGVQQLIKVLPEVISNEPNIHLIVAGKGTYKEQLVQLTKQLGLVDNITFIGWIDNINEEIQKSVAVIVPSICMDNAPVIIQEAMMCSRPVIGADRGGIPDMIKVNETGYTFDNTLGLICAMLNLAKDNGLVKQLGTEARKQIINQKDKLDEIYGHYQSD